MDLTAQLAIYAGGVLTGLYIGFAMGGEADTGKYVELQNSKAQLEVLNRQLERHAKPAIVYVVTGNRARHQADLGGHYPGTRTTIPGAVVIAVLAKAHRLHRQGRFFSRAEMCERGGAVLTQTQYELLRNELAAKGYLVPPGGPGQVCEWTFRGEKLLRGCATAHARDILHNRV